MNSRIGRPVADGPFFWNDKLRIYHQVICFFVCIVFASVAAPGPVMAQYPPSVEIKNPGSKLENLKGKVVDIWLTDGKVLAGAEVVDVKVSRQRQTPTSIRVMVPVPISLKVALRAPAGKKPKKRKRKSKWVAARKVSEIYIDNRPLDVVYRKKSKTLEFSSSKRKERVDHQKEVAKRLSAKRKKYWPNLSEKEQQEHKKKLDDFLEKAKTAFAGKKLESKETEFFILATDLPAQNANFYLFQLDEMYKKLSLAFGLSPDKNIWCGKCLAFIFKDEATFTEFESRFHEFEPKSKPRPGGAPGAVGICHQLPDGRVIFAGYQGDNREFPNTVVHETTHGFVFRYMSNIQLPNWLNEGISDWASAQIAGKSRIERKQRFAARQVAESLSWGGDFLTAKNINAWQYGVASAVVDILIKNQKKDEFRQFVILIKEGHDPEVALKKTYDIDFKQLEAIYVKKATGRNMPAQASGEEGAGQGQGTRRGSGRGRGN